MHLSPFEWKQKVWFVEKCVENQWYDDVSVVIFKPNEAAINSKPYIQCYW